MHSNLSVNSKPKKKRMLLMIRNGDRPSQRGFARGLDSNPRPEPRGAAAGPGRPTLKESHPTHQIPSSTSSVYPPHAIQPRQTCTYKSRKRQVGTTGLPMWFHTRGVVSCRILQSPGKSPNTSLLPEENTPDIEQTNGALTVQWSSNFHESITRGRRNESGTL